MQEYVQKSTSTTLPRSEAAAAERDEQHRHGRAERVGDDQEHGLRVQVLAAGAHGDVAEDRSGAGDEDEPEAQAEEEASARPCGTAAREGQERPLEELAETRDEQRGRDDEEEDERRAAEEVVRQPEPVDDPRGGEREDRH